MRGKPPLFRFYCWLGKELGHEGLQRVVENFRRSTGRKKADLPVARAILRRALGREPGAEELDAAAEERLSIQSDIETTLYLLDEGSGPELRGRLKTPALAAVKKAQAAGKGVILASPHFGNYSLLMLGLAAAGLPLHVMFINSSAYGWLAPLGLTAVPFGRGALDYTRALAEGKAVFAFADLDFFPGGRLASFLGAPLRPPHGLARLSEATGAPVLPVYALRQNGKWRAEADALIPSGAAEDVEAALLRSMERRIRENPGHWVIFQDPWDVQAMDRANRRQWAKVSFVESILPRI